MDRTDPDRFILGAVRQKADAKSDAPPEVKAPGVTAPDVTAPDGGASGGAAGGFDAAAWTEASVRNGRSGDPGADPLGALNGALNGAGAASAEAGGLWETAEEAVRAIYSVADQQMAEGEAVARELAATATAARSEDVPKILTRLVQTYSDLGAVWVQLLTAAIERSNFGDAAAAPQSGGDAAGAGAAIAVEVVASRPVTARAQLFGAIGGAPAALPLNRVGGGEGPAPAVGFAPGPTVRITASDDVAAGDYHGVILSAAGGAPVGSITVRITSGA